MPRHSAATGYTLTGRSASSFTRIVRLFAEELGVGYELRIVGDLMSREPADYGGHPALKLPALDAPQGTWFGSLAICRVFARAAAQRAAPLPSLVWPETLESPLLSNAQELVLVGLSTGVGLILSGVQAPSETPHRTKMQASLRGTLAWLDANVDAILAALPPEPRLSYLEVGLFCLLEHLEFRAVMDLPPAPRLAAFRARFAERPSAARTRYAYDA